jgi:outer membrane lipoprotein-sorting protein
LRIAANPLKLKFALAAAALAACVLASPPPANAQNPDTIPAAQSTAQAKAIIQQLIEGMGGPAYLNMHDSDCTGRLSQFSPITGERGAYLEFQEFRMPPDKLRREYTKKARIIDVYNGNRGWSLDKGGVEDGDAVAVANFQATVQMSLDNLLRFRLSDPTLYFHYGGEDAVDLRQADWVEIEDTDERTFRVAVDRSTHLPVRFIVVTHNPQTRDVTHDVTIFANWHTEEGIPTAFTVRRERDDRPLSQSFYYSCKYNTGLSASFFTREALAERWKQMGHKNSK